MENCKKRGENKIKKKEPKRKVNNETKKRERERKKIKTNKIE